MEIEKCWPTPDKFIVDQKLVYEDEGWPPYYS